VALGIPVQEVVFRGLIFTGLARVWSPAVAVVASAAMFASVHVSGGAFQVGYSFVFGLIAAELFRRSKSLLPSSVMHVLANSYPMVLILSR
jgi:membrane protease YdiL (CAAX protease family)